MAPSDPFLKQNTNQHWVPDWASHADVDQIDADDPYPPIAYMAMKYILAALALLWGFWVACPFFVFYESTCDPDGALAAPPAHCLLGYLPFLGAALGFEFQGCKWLHKQVADKLGPYKICGMQLHFVVYLLLVLGLSAMQHMDLYTSGLSVGRLAKAALDCPDNRIERVWAQVAGASAFGRMPALHSLAAVAWAGMAAQLLLALLHGLPVARRVNNDDFGGVRAVLACRRVADLDGVAQEGRCVAVPASGAGAPQSTDLALQAAAEGARANLVLFRDADRYVQEHGSWLDQNTFVRNIMATKLVKDAYRAALSLALEGAGLANVQASALAVTKAIAASAAVRAGQRLDSVSVDKATAASIVISAMASTYTLTMAVLRTKKLVGMIWPYCQEDDATDQDFKKDFPALYGGGPRRRRRQVAHAVTVLSITVAGTVLLQGYAALKTIMAACVCEYGPWNLRGGCVPGPFL